MQKTFEETVRESNSGREGLAILTDDVKTVMKLRDSGRVAFLENKKSYENVQAQLQNENVPAEEKTVLTGALKKYFERAQNYLHRYDCATEALRIIRANEKAIADAKTEGGKNNA